MRLVVNVTRDRRSDDMRWQIPAPLILHSARKTGTITDYKNLFISA